MDDDDGAMVAALRHRRDLQELVYCTVRTVIEGVVGEVGQRGAVGIDHEEVAEVGAAPVGNRAKRSVVASAGEASESSGGGCGSCDDESRRLWRAACDVLDPPEVIGEEARNVVGWGGAVVVDVEAWFLAGGAAQHLEGGDDAPLPLVERALQPPLEGGVAGFGRGAVEEHDAKVRMDRGGWYAKPPKMVGWEGG